MHQTKIGKLNTSLLAIKSLSLAFSVSSATFNTSPVTSNQQLDKTDKFSKKLVEKGNFKMYDFVLAGKFESLLYIDDGASDIDSFESTDQTNDSNENPETKQDVFKHKQVVWAKRTLSPWFPAIVIDINENETKHLIKSIGASFPSKKYLESIKMFAQKTQLKEQYYFVLMLNKKKTWAWLPESKLRQFNKENDVLFLDKADNFLKEKYKFEIFRAYKKAINYVNFPEKS